jgi:arabinofuranan 3-O-arabinosyltransferase
VRLLSTEQFGPVALTLRSGGDPASRAVTRSRSLQVRSTSDTRVVLDVGPGQTAIVSAPFNENAGWEASVDGRRLEPITVDGWAQGFVVPAGVSGAVVLSYGPQSSYLIGLIAGLVILGCVLLWGTWVLCGQPLWRRWARRSRPPAQPLPAQSLTPRSVLRAPRARQVVVAGVAVFLGLLVGGPVLGVAAGVGVVVGRWSRVVQALVFGGLMVALGMLVVALVKEAGKPSDAVDLVTGAALALGFGAAWWPAPEVER